MPDDKDLNYFAAPTLILDERIKRIIAGAINEIDREQIAILRTLTPAERVRQALSIIQAGENAAAYRLRQKEPSLDKFEALRKVRFRSMRNKENLQRWRTKK